MVLSYNISKAYKQGINSADITDWPIIHIESISRTVVKQKPQDFFNEMINRWYATIVTVVYFSESLKIKIEHIGIMINNFPICSIFLKNLIF